MSTHIAVGRLGQCGGAPTYLSVEKGITIFTLFTYVMGHGHAHPRKRWSMSDNKHYVTRIGVLMGFLPANKGRKGGVICRIRWMGRGAGVLGDLFSNMAWGLRGAGSNT
jgi:hypothetical protein